MPESVVAELDVFSGRPNPSWILTPQEAKDLAIALEHLPNELPPGSAGFQSEGLGYRGVVVSNQSHAPGLPIEIRAGNGFVLIGGGGRSRSYRDEPGIEKLLLRQAERHGHGDVVKSLTG